MSATLYSIELLRLAAAVADYPPLDEPHRHAERRSPTCGSRMTTTLRLDADGRIAAVGLDARACALGQAAATIFARAAIGADADRILAANEGWRAYLARESDALPDWPDLDRLMAGRDYPARHPSMRLAFETAAAALTAAGTEPAADD